MEHSPAINLRNPVGALALAGIREGDVDLSRRVVISPAVLRACDIPGCHANPEVASGKQSAHAWRNGSVNCNFAGHDLIAHLCSARLAPPLSYPRRDHGEPRISYRTDYLSGCRSQNDMREPRAHRRQSHIILIVALREDEQADLVFFLTDISARTQFC